MSNKRCKKKVNSSEGFSLKEKFLMSLGFYGAIIIGVYGIYLESILWVAIYLGFLIFGVFVLFGYSLCAHCPYVYEYSDCLFPPLGQLVGKIYKFRPQPMNTLDKIGPVLMIVGVIAIPQYWLFQNLIIFAIFWIFCLPTMIGLVFYECRRCLCVGCPLNQVKKGSGAAS